MEFSISHFSSIPIYEQIEQKIKEKIIRGQWLAMQQLPSIRQLAADLEVGIITVKRAYDDLEREGYIFNQQGKGCFVKEVDTTFLKKEVEKNVKESLKEIIHNAKLHGISEEEWKQLCKKGWDENE